MPRTHWNLWLLPAALAAAALLYFSWFEWEATRQWWDRLDILFFSATNRSLAESHSWAVFWSIANNRTFDMVPALLFMGLFIAYIRGDGSHDGKTAERACAVILAGLSVLLVTQLERAYMDVGRASPTLVMEMPFLLSEHILWIATKDRSGNSFPSDHGTVSVMFALYLCAFGGRRFVMYSAIAVVLSVLPRLVGGAHWLTDILVGTMLLSLPAVALTLATPLIPRLAAAGGVLINRWMGWAPALFLAFTSKERFVLMCKGAGIGVADIVPGMSGGTMAVILGVYQQIIQSVTRLDKSWFSRILHVDLRGAVAEIPFLFILPLVLGGTIAVIILTRLIPVPHLLTAYPEPVYGLFFGLVAGSVILLCMQHVRAHLTDFLLLAGGCALGFLLMSHIYADTPDEPWFIFISGILFVLAMLLPGLSGSFILLILGKYALILTALGEMDMTLLLPFFSGCVVGLLCFAHALNWVLQRYYVISMTVITGLLIGSLWMVWPFQYREFAEISGQARLVSSTPHWPTTEQPLSITVIMMLSGLIIVFLLHHLKGRKQRQAV